MMKSEENKEFLLKQREKGRPGSMLGVDLKLARTEERKLKKSVFFLLKCIAKLGSMPTKHIRLPSKSLTSCDVC